MADLGSIAMERERGNVFRLELRGVLRKNDLERCEQQLMTEIERHGPVRLLFTMRGFAGWEPSANWNDLGFYMQHGDSIERIAIVGPERWRSESLMFAGADLRRATVEFFNENALSDARSWLSSGSPEPHAGKEMKP